MKTKMRFMFPGVLRFIQRLTVKSRPTLVGQLLAILTTLFLSAALPTRTATAASAPSFRVGDRVQTVDPARVWVTPPLSGRFIGSQPSNALGAITDGPVRAAEASWWKVHFDSGVDGWVADRQIRNLNQRPATGDQ